MSVLAHIIDRGALQAEPAATQALAYILRSSPDIAFAFVGMLQEADIEFEPGRIEAEQAVEEARPDLTLQDSDGRVRVLVENKFWAGLTAAQPVDYLDNLPEDPPSALLFIVPQQRVAAVWNELKARCSEANRELTEAPGGGAATWVRVGSKTLMIASWSHILERLLDAAGSSEHDNVRRDILQLRGLAGREDLQAFLPLCADEVTDQQVARRLVNYSDLIEDITQKLKGSGVAQISGLRPTHGYYTAGRYLRVHGRFQLWLGVHLGIWRDAGITPLWCSVGDARFRGVAGQLETVRDHFDDAQLYEDRTLWLPIRLRTGVERERVMEDATLQMTQIADRLLEAFPDEEANEA